MVKSISTHNSQENAFIERVHKFEYMLRSFDLENKHENPDEQQVNSFH
jgi:hypothetical protein